MESIDKEIQKQQQARAAFDSEIYSDASKDAYMTEIADEDPEPRTMLTSYSAPKHLVNETAISNNDPDYDPMMATAKSRVVLVRKEGYQKQGLENRVLSPERSDAFAGGKKSDRSYKEVMREKGLDKEEKRVNTLVAEKLRKEAEESRNPNKTTISSIRKRRFDDAPTPSNDVSTKETQKQTSSSSTEWTDDETVHSSTSKRQRTTGKWDDHDSDSTVIGSTPKKGAQFDETPRGNVNMETPVGVHGMETPVASSSSQPLGNMTPGSLGRFEREMDFRNRYLSDEELNAIFPSSGYKILEPPSSYIPIRTPARKLAATPTPVPGQMGDGGFMMQEDQSYGISNEAGDLIPEIPGFTGQLQFFKEEDMKHFGKLMDKKKEEDMSVEELKERKIMRLLLKIKNGEPRLRKGALRQITESAREFGAAALFNQILPLLMSPTLEDQERHLMVKVIDRILYKLDDLVRPYVHKILVVIEPLLIDEDYYARVEGREIISNLAKAAGLAAMIATMRPDIDHIDEYVRNTTARAFAVVASALGVPSLLPFLKAVCKSKKSWQARHTGIKIVQQIAILMGCAILPHLKSLVDTVGKGLEDEQPKVRTISALALSSLAEASSPYGIESFGGVIDLLKDGVRKHRGKGRAAFIKAIGYLIPLMQPEQASLNTRVIMRILIKEFDSPDEEMKKIVLKVVKQCVGTDGVTSEYIKDEVLGDFFRCFWTWRMALDRRNSRQLIETTVELAEKVGVSEILKRIVHDLKDENEPFRKMVMEAIEKVVSSLGTADIDSRLEEVLIDGMLTSFQEQTVEDVVMLNGFGTIVNSLGIRCKPYLQQVASTVLWRLNNKSAKVRQQAADLVSKICPVMQVCGEEKMMGTLGVVLHEYLGEEYPEVLGSILGGLRAVVDNIGMSSMTPPIKDLLPRLTPILKNRHEKVQENVIELVGKIADKGAEYVSAREWMRICFELLDMLKANRKTIRRATVLTFGYIAKAIGPQDVLATLLNNLKVQERQNRVCTTVAIAIVAETCAPFTVLPALMNEYRVPELNVQNGVLKSLAFLFEYIGEVGKDYIYAVTPLLEDALIDRDLVHRQTACAAVKHMALGVVGLNCEDAMQHLLNYVWPNIFETSPHVINSVLESIDALRCVLGPAAILQYTLQGLFHPARRVRDVYWKVYNNLYIGAQDGLIPYYPRIENDERNFYVRTELEMFV